MNHPFHPVADSDGECAICHNGIGSTVHAEGREGVDRMSLDDLFIWTYEEAWECPTSRPATREDVLAAVREWEGVEEVWRCWDNVVLGAETPVDWTPHLSRPSYCKTPNGHHHCGLVLIVHLDTGDTE